jgi:hypothetical protein
MAAHRSAAVREEGAAHKPSPIISRIEEILRYWSLLGRERWHFSTWLRATA